MSREMTALFIDGVDKETENDDPNQEKEEETKVVCRLEGFEKKSTKSGNSEKENTQSEISKKKSVKSDELAKRYKGLKDFSKHF